MRRAYKHVLLFALLTPFVCLAMTASQIDTGLAQTAAEPNILFILTDDMKARELQYMPNTQSLLADQGVKFTEAYVTRSLCCPSRATVLRGQYTHNHHVWTNVNPSGGFWNFYDQGLDKSTIATWLDDPGNFDDHLDYDTVLIGKYLNRYGLDRNGNYDPTTYVPPGWDEWYAWEGNYYSDETYDINEWKSSDGQPQGHIVTYQRAQIHDTDLHAQVAEDFIRRTAGDGRPFFMYLAPNAPHAPAYYAPRHASMFSNERLPRPSSFNEADVSDKPQWVQDKPLLTSAQISDMTRFYRNRLRALQSVDEMVKQLVHTLSTEKDPLTGKPLIDNTYIVFTSDNGIYLGEHRLQNKAAAYNAAPSVPLVIRGPGVPQGKTRSKIALNNDLAPTFASWAGVTPPDFVDGRSLVPLLTESPPASWRSGGFLVEHRRSPEEYDYVRDIPNYSALRTARYHYVEYETGEKELYDASTDPTELDNLLAPDAPPPDPALLSSLKMRLDALKRCAGSNCRTAEDDITSPVLHLPDDITEEATGPHGAKVAWPPPMATDEYPANPEVTCAPPSSSTFPLGKTTVTCRARDIVGNEAQGSFNVTVRDTTPPTIGGVPADITEEATGPNGAKVSWQPPSATDTVDGSVGVKCSSDSGLTSGDTFPLGTTQINCEATDRAGNKAIETFKVIVSDTTPPQILGVPAEPMNVTATSAQGVTVSYRVPAAIDDVDGDVPVRCAPDTSTLFPLGITTVRCTATDSRGNTATASFKVSITYAWSGVLQPINSDGSSIFKLGSTVPVNFRLTAESAGISDATAKLYVAQVSNGIAGPEVEAVSTSAATEGNLFRYDAESDQYVFNWSTKALQTGRGTYQLRIDLGDGTTNTVLVSLR